MRTGSVSSSELSENRFRLNGGFFLTEDQSAIRLLLKLRACSQSIGSLCTGRGVFRGPIFRKMSALDGVHGRPYVSARDIEFSTIRPAGFISSLHGEKLLRELEIHEGMILVTCSGMTLGRVVWARADLAGMFASGDLIRVLADPTKIPPGYLYAYLAGRFGRVSIRRQLYGGHVKHIDPKHIESIFVPRIDRTIEQKVHKWVVKASILLGESSVLLDEATATLFKKVGVSNPSRAEWETNREDLGFVVRRSDLRTLRAWNLSRRVRDIVSQIEAGKYSPLGELIDLDWLRWRVMFERREASREHAIEVLAQRPLFRLLPEGRWLSRSYLLNHSPRFVVPDETILVAKQGTLGEHELFCRCEFITGSAMLARAYSDHCMRVVARPECVDAGYLFAFLRSDAGFRLLRSLAEGSKQQDLHWRTVPELPIPRCKKNDESNIGDHVREALRKRNEATELLMRSQTEVEILLDRSM